MYALSFFLIPALRWASNVAKNRVIEARNDSRAAAAKALSSPSPTLQRKLDRCDAPKTGPVSCASWLDLEHHNLMHS